ncbi:SRPBCC family protein [Phytohabitans kaempferiae]|uniref:SRPBCC family protein n=1 Tax=Phytohabitans kaempferiae TaxID=1620943 RepID=A0ABV6LZ63_9ACTN
MIEADYTIELAVPVEKVWEYVEKIPNWAPFVIGFQKLELVDERRSVWTLRGDVGILTREVDIQADITVWEPLRRAEFTITGITERLSGRGTFDLYAMDGAASEAGPTSEAAPPPAPAAPRRDGPLRRLRFAVARFLLRRLNRRAKATPDAAAPAPAAGAGAVEAGTGGGSRLVFHLEVAPGGPMAPMIELLMAPMIEPAAQDFLRDVRAALEGGRDAVGTP